MIGKYDKKNKFFSTFDPNTGFYYRSGIMDENGKDTGVDPFMASFPELIDVGIMQTCVCAKQCNVDCYQKAIDRTGENMSVENFERLLKEMKGKTFQCLKDDEVVLRKNGNHVESVYIGDIKAGDSIFCGGDTFNVVTEKYENIDDIYEIDVGYGKKIIATKDHRFLTRNGLLKKVSELEIGDELLSSKGNFNIKPIDRLNIVDMIISFGMDGSFYLSDCPGMDDICKKYNIKRNTHKTVLISNIKDYLNEIDYSSALITRERSQFKFNTFYEITEDLMVLLGHYVGNGSERRYVISNTQHIMIQSIKNALDNSFPNFVYTIYEKENACIIELNSSILHKELFDNIFRCRINREKQLPNFIFSVSNEMKLAFLRGYFCDGNMSIHEDDGKYGEITFNTSSKKLYKDLTMLLGSINIDYSVSIQEGGQTEFSKSDKRIINRKTRYRIKIGNLLEIEKLYSVVSDHKNGKHFNDVVMSDHNPKYLRKRKKYTVKSITKLDKKERVVDININSKDHLFVTTHFIVSHNCALGGAGDVDTHENFEEILRLCREYNIVPNFTTSGIAMTKEKAEICKKYVGAIAVSEHFAKYTNDAIDMLLEAGVKTNLHYVLNDFTIDDAITKIKTDGFKKGINAVIFLLYKPVGLGRMDKVLRADNPKVKEFFEAIDNCKVSHKIGFDSCTIPGIINFTTKINPDSYDTCEGARWSMYITSDMKALPCSFDNQDLKWAYDISNDTIQNAWDSKQFEGFRKHFRKSCALCDRRSGCMGGCPIRKEVVLCNRDVRDVFDTFDNPDWR